MPFKTLACVLASVGFAVGSSWVTAVQPIITGVCGGGVGGSMRAACPCRDIGWDLGGGRSDFGPLRTQPLELLTCERIKSFRKMSGVGVVVQIRVLFLVRTGAHIVIVVVVTMVCFPSRSTGTTPQLDIINQLLLIRIVTIIFDHYHHLCPLVV
jgi:hypothetical protein